MSKQESNDQQAVYLIQHEHFYYKIGISNDPEGRLKELQTACPYRLLLIGVYECDNARAAEALFHQKYDEHHIRGEWYELPSEAVFEIEEMCDLSGQQLRNRLKNTDERRREVLTWQGLIG